MKQTHIDPKKYPGINPSKIVNTTGSDVSIYGFTEFKDRLNLFKNSRNMDIFTIIEKKIDKETLIDIINDEYYKEFYLEPWKLASEIIDKRGFNTSYYVSVLSTEREFRYILTKQDSIFIDMMEEYDKILFDKVPSNIFKDEYKEALEKSVQYSEFMSSDGRFMNDAPWVPVKYNMLSLYCNIFKNTYSEKGEYLCECGSFSKSRTETVKYQKR